MPLIRCALALAALLFAASPARAGGACSPDFVLEQLRVGRLGRIDRVADLPKEVLAEFQRTIAKHDPPLLAEPGEEFQATDVVDPAKPPLLARRLIFAGFSKTLFVLYYERGGIAHTRHAFVYCNLQGIRRSLSVLFPPGAPEAHDPHELGVGLRREQVVEPPRED